MLIPCTTVRTTATMLRIWESFVSIVAFLLDQFIHSRSFEAPIEIYWTFEKNSRFAKQQGSCMQLTKNQSKTEYQLLVFKN